jgi:hypothetical protein
MYIIRYVFYFIYLVFIPDKCAKLVDVGIRPCVTTQ